MQTTKVLRFNRKLIKFTTQALKVVSLSPLQLITMAFNENTRVKIPAILHLCRLGYQYLSFAKAERDASANLFSGIFEESMLRLNPGMSPEEARRLAYITGGDTKAAETP